MNNRRQFLKGLAATAVGGLMVEPQGLFAETLTATPGQNRRSVLSDHTAFGYDLKGASPGAPVFLHLWKSNVDLGISGPYGQITDTAGAWSMTGSYGLGDVGSWQLQAVIGSAASSETSSSIGARIAVN